MFTVSIDNLPVPNIPMPDTDHGQERRPCEETFFWEDEALLYANRLVKQGYIVRIEAPNRDDIVICIGLLRTGKELTTARVMELPGDFVAAPLRRTGT